MQLRDSGRLWHVSIPRRCATGGQRRALRGRGRRPRPRLPARPGAKRATESRANKKAEVIAMMKRAKGVKLAEIVEATGWQKYTVRGFVSILGSKGAAAALDRHE
jgi:hypothetical protein